MKEQNLLKEKEWFDKAQKYKGGSDELDQASINKYLEDLIQKTQVNYKSKVLEIACGGGQWGVTLVKRTNCSYIGLDLSPALLKSAKTNAKKQKVKVNYIEGDAKKLPFKKESFDLVFVTYSLHHFPSAESLKKVTKEAYRVLKKGGIYYTLEPNGLNPFVFLWWLKKSPERILPLGKTWLEDNDLTANETIIYPWVVSNSFKGLFKKVKIYGLGFIPHSNFFKKQSVFWERVAKIIGKTPFLNKFGGSFVVWGKKN